MNGVRSVVFQVFMSVQAEVADPGSRFEPSLGDGFLGFQTFL